MSVPKIIMQTWKTKDVPEHWKTSPESLKKLNPEWLYVLLTDEDCERLVMVNFPGYLDLYRGYKHNIQRADLIRPMWLYLHGGVYMDLDYELIRPLDGLFAQDSGDTNVVYLIKSSNLKSSYTNSFMASTPKNPFWLVYLREIARRGVPETEIEYISVMYSAGPATLSNVTQNWKGDSKVVTIPSNLINPCSVCDNDCESRGIRYTKQLQGQSWHGATTYCISWFWCNVYYIVALLLFITLLWLNTKKGK